MPPNLIGALVVCFASAEDHLAALRAVVAKLTSDGYVFQDMHGQLCELDPSRWRDYVASKWSEFTGHFPTQDELLRRVEAGEIFYGPFCGYETES
jgi:hypothetical protein